MQINTYLSNVPVPPGFHPQTQVQAQAQAVRGYWNKMPIERFEGELLTTSNHNSNNLSFEQQQQPSGFTTSIHNSQRIIPSSIPAASSHSSKLIINNNSSLSLLPPPASSSDPMEQHLYHLPSSHHVKMYNIDPLPGPSLGHQQQDVRFSPMIPGSFDMRPRRYHPYSNPRMRPPSHQMNLNDGQSSSLSQAINHTFRPTTMSIEPSHTQNLGPSAPLGQLQTNAIHSYASSGDIPNSQQQQSLLNDPEFLAILNHIRVPPPNRNVDDGQPPPY